MEQNCVDPLTASTLLDSIDADCYLLSKETQCTTATPLDDASTVEQQQQQQHQQLLMTSLHIKQLLAEKQSLEESSTEGVNQFSLTQKLLVNELDRLQNGCRPFTGGANKLGVEERRFADIIKDKPIKVTIRVLVPAKEHPKFNFVGKLLGPKGNSLKRLQEDTMTKMAILGRGSMRDKHKEEELRTSGDPKFSHLNDDLHVEVTAFAPPAEAHARIAYALAEVRRFLVPDYNDDIRQGQMREMQLLNTSPLTSSPCDVIDTSSQISPATSPAPSTMQNVAGAAGNGGGGKQQNGRQMSFASPPQNGGRNCFLYNQQLLIHPAFRGLTPRGHDMQLPNATVFRGNSTILNRLRPPLHLPATAGINNNSRVSPTTIKHRNGLLNHHGNTILSILAGGPRSLFGDQLLAADGTIAGENMLLCASDSGVMAAEEDMVNAAGMFAGFENYATANGNGYTLMDSFGNAGSLMSGDPMDELSLGQEALNAGLSVELPGSRIGDGAGSVKIDRARYRHDPYGRFPGIKLPL